MEYFAERIAMLRYHIIQEDESGERAAEYLNEHLQFPEFRKLAIRQALDNERFEEAIHLASQRILKITTYFCERAKNNLLNIEAGGRQLKAIQISQFGGPEVLKCTEVDEPIPVANEVRVRLFAAGVNPNETYIRTGTYSFYIPALPYTPGFDGAGVVDALGVGVKHLKIGDRVFVAALLAKRNTGTYAQKVVCDASAVHRLPESISYQQGASLGIPALTAYRALFQRAKIKPGETVLIHGASGGVGLLAVQMAKGIGATVIGTASTEEGKSMVTASGAVHVLDHITEDSIDKIISLTNDKGPEVIIEFLANVNLETDLKIIAPYGRIVVVGNRGSLEINPRLAMMKEADILGLALWNALPDEYNESLHAVEAFLECGILHPEIGDELTLEDAGKAHEQIVSMKANGKIVLSID